MRRAAWRTVRRSVISILHFHDPLSNPVRHRHGHGVAQHPVAGAVGHAIDGGPVARKALEYLTFGWRKPSHSEGARQMRERVPELVSTLGADKLGIWRTPASAGAFFSFSFYSWDNVSLLCRSISMQAGTSMRLWPIFGSQRADRGQNVGSAKPAVQVVDRTALLRLLVAIVAVGGKGALGYQFLDACIIPLRLIGTCQGAGCRIAYRQPCLVVYSGSCSLATASKAALRVGGRARPRFSARRRIPRAAFGLK